MSKPEKPEKSTQITKQITFNKDFFESIPVLKEENQTVGVLNNNQICQKEKKEYEECMSNHISTVCNQVYKNYILCINKYK